MTFKFDLDKILIYQHAKYLKQWPFSSNYCPDMHACTHACTHTHTHTQTDRHKSGLYQQYKNM